jgi:hypothetical protein
MTENPYAPPKAAINEVTAESPAARPREVARAVWLSWIGIALGDILNTVDTALHPAVGRPGLLVTVVVGLPLGILIAWWINGKILKGRNWARILQLIGLLSVPLTLYTILTNPMYAQSRVMPLVAQAMTWPLYAWSTWLLFSSPGKEWFRKRAR